MSILVKGSFCYPIVFLPNKRSRKTRKTVLKSFFYQAYLELEESEFPLVFEYKDKFRKGLPIDNVHVRSYNGKFYEQVAFNMTHSGIVDFFKRTLDYPVYNSDYKGLDQDVWSAISNSEHVLHNECLLTEESIIHFDLKNEFLKRSLDKSSYKNYVIFKDGIWERCNEPKYIVEMPISVFDERIPHITISQNGVFNALQLEEAKKYMLSITDDSLKSKLTEKMENYIWCEPIVVHDPLFVTQHMPHRHCVSNDKLELAKFISNQVKEIEVRNSFINLKHRDGYNEELIMELIWRGENLTLLAKLVLEESKFEMVQDGDDYIIQDLENYFS